MTMSRYSSVLRHLVRQTPICSPHRLQSPSNAAAVLNRPLSSTPNRKSDSPLNNKAASLTAIFQRLNWGRDYAVSLYSSISTSPYGRLMRLDKPTGTHLLFLPAAWSISLGAPTFSEWVHLIPLFYCGSVLLRGAGCTINDIWDADIDRQVSRTRTRPIAAGEISSSSAFLFLGAQFSGGLLILSQLNTASFLVGSLSVLPLMFYPFAKRHTNYPQAVLGLTINWGALLGSSASTGAITVPALLMYGAGCCWTIVYDTIYAHQDKKDDQVIGVLSTALSFGQKSKLILSLFAAGQVALLSTAGFAGDLSWPYFACVSLSGLHAVRQIATTDLNDATQCQRAFDSNVMTGTIVWLGVMAGRMV